MRRVAAAVAGLATILLWTAAPAAAAPSPEAEQRLVTRTASARADARVPAYSTQADLAEVARRHAQRMAEDGELYHNPHIVDEVENWQEVGENIGHGRTADVIHDEWMASQEHRARILSTQYTEVGIGVFVDDGGLLWVSQVFRRPMNSQPPADDDYFEPDRPESEPQPQPQPAPSDEQPPAAEPASAQPAPAPPPARRAAATRTAAPTTTTSVPTPGQPAPAAATEVAEVSAASVNEPDSPPADSTPDTALSVEEVAFSAPARGTAAADGASGRPIGVIAAGGTALWAAAIALVVILRRRSG